MLKACRAMELKLLCYLIWVLASCWHGVQKEVYLINKFINLQSIYIYLIKIFNISMLSQIFYKEIKLLIIY